MSRALNNENAAFAKMMEGLRHAVEGAAELALHREDQQMMRVSRMLDATRQKVGEVAMAGSVRRASLRN